MMKKYAALAIAILSPLFLSLLIFDNWMEQSNVYKKRYLIYKCPNEGCGVAEQLQGMISVFDLAMKTNRIFGTIVSERCSPLYFLRPHMYNWMLHQKDISHLPSISFSSNVITAAELDENLKDGVSIINDVKENVVYIQVGNMSIQNAEFEQYREIYEKIFLVHYDIENELIFFRQTNVGRNKTVCANIRTGIHDTHYNNLRDISSIWNFLSHYDRKGYVIFVASDSTDVKTSARKRFSKRIIELPDDPILTTNATGDKLCSGHRKVFLDLLFLARCDIVLLTYSEISRMASILRRKQEDQYCFQNNTIGVYPCPMFNLQWRISGKEKLPLQGIQ